MFTLVKSTQKVEPGSYLGKSMRVVCIRFNLSKSGIGVSAGPNPELSVRFNLDQGGIAGDRCKDMEGQ